MNAPPSKHGSLNQYCINVGPPSSTLAQHWNSIRWMSRVCWVGMSRVRGQRWHGKPHLTRDHLWCRVASKPQYLRPGPDSDDNNLVCRLKTSSPARLATPEVTDLAWRPRCVKTCCREDVIREHYIHGIWLVDVACLTNWMRNPWNAEICYRNQENKGSFSIWNHYRCFSQLFLIHLNTCVMGLRLL